MKIRSSSRWRDQLAKFKLTKNGRPIRKRAKKASYRVEFYHKKIGRKLRFVSNAKLNFALRDKLHLGLTISSILLVAIALLVVIYSPLLRIESITLADGVPSRISQAQLNTALSDLYGRNLLFVTTDRILTQLVEYHPELKKVAIDKKPPHTLIVYPTDFALVATISTDEGRGYLLNEIGYITDLEPLGEEGEKVRSSLLRIEIKTNHKLKVKTQVIDIDSMGYIFGAVDQLRHDFPDWRATKAIYNQTARQLELVIRNRWTLLFDITKPYADQLEVLKTVLAYQDPDRLKFDYIDLRIPQKAYLKPPE